MVNKCYNDYTLQNDGKTCIASTCPLNSRPYDADKNYCLMDCNTLNFVTKNLTLYCASDFNSKKNSKLCEYPYVKNGNNPVLTNPPSSCIKPLLSLARITTTDKYNTRIIPPYTNTNNSDPANIGLLLPLKYTIY